MSSSFVPFVQIQIQLFHLSSIFQSIQLIQFPSRHSNQKTSMYILYVPYIAYSQYPDCVGLFETPERPLILEPDHSVYRSH
ncbi:hypothetical protein B0I72DRAFT_36968 [Yarrowia lipolytica]|uniref:Uncharacterized protein n=1 Tax=Yarrowia lipolytica TaxID=4952 RepID=A0A371BXN5_YARLL|nr:hypothetical protein B0I71DRAFT_20784 [Yarrowia lipolytica]RDW32541.1 hypothetical protein B0I72DRAFT_36968 [Yarrowia lipolytica]RDW42979.1 hypothetical protein B0I74DRAFT_15447 [Yarrowia lipolytica]RDW51177.1 hypothetical protein B0I75DRAFT_45305 [Yarrowia lipolytica]